MPDDTFSKMTVDEKLWQVKNDLENVHRLLGNIAAHLVSKDKELGEHIQNISLKLEHLVLDAQPESGDTH